MNAHVRDTLCRMLATYGADVVADVRRCEGLLRDLCPQDKREVHVLLGALREHVPAELAAPALRRGALGAIGRLARRLEDNLALAAGPARWAVESWALALGVVTAKQLAAAPPKQPRAAQVVPPPVIVRTAPIGSRASIVRIAALAAVLVCVATGVVVAVSWKAPAPEGFPAKAAAVVLLPETSTTVAAALTLPSADTSPAALPPDSIAVIVPQLSSEPPQPISDEEAEIVQGALHASSVRPTVDRVADR